MNAQQTAKTQYHYVFSIQKDEAALYDILEPNLVQVSKETLTLSSGKQPQITDMTHLDPENMHRGQIPSVSVLLNQQNGQLNVHLSPVTASIIDLPRTPASDRIDSKVRNIGEMLQQSKSALEQIAQDEKSVIKSTRPPQIPKPETRQVITSPAGVAVRTPQCSQFLPIGSMRSPNGTIWTPKGSMYSPGGTFFWPPDTLVAEDGSAVTPAGTYYGPERVGYGLAGHVYTPNGSQLGPNGSIRAPWVEYASYVRKSPAVVRSIRQPKKSHSSQSDSAESKPLAVTMKRVNHERKTADIMPPDSHSFPMRVEPIMPASRKVNHNNVNRDLVPSEDKDSPRASQHRPSTVQLVEPQT